MPSDASTNRPRRKRMRRVGRLNRTRLLTFSCLGRMQLLGNPAIRDAFVPMLFGATLTHAIKLRAWVVMPEHIHLLVRPTQEPGVVPFLWNLKRDFAKLVIARWKELDAPILNRIRTKQGRYKFWLPGGGHDEVTEGDVADVIAYIHNNPVKHGLVQKAADWKWSSAGWSRDDRRPRTTAPR